MNKYSLYMYAYLLTIWEKKMSFFSFKLWVRLAYFVFYQPFLFIICWLTIYTFDHFLYFNIYELIVYDKFHFLYLTTIFHSFLLALCYLWNTEVLNIYAIKLLSNFNYELGILWSFCKHSSNIYLLIFSSKTSQL